MQTKRFRTNQSRQFIDLPSLVFNNCIIIIVRRTIHGNLIFVLNLQIVDFLFMRINSKIRYIFVLFCKDEKTNRLKFASEIRFKQKNCNLSFL